ncbi:MAG: AAA family ATPase [Proteobacteria bacterium]|nr:AAA family ATPase [Pseudomonadota bacterium]
MPSVSENEHARLEALLRLSIDAGGGHRPAFIASGALIKCLEALISKCPGFHGVISVWLGAAHLSCRSRTPFSVPPVLLVGSPGIGKTRFLSELANVLNVAMAPGQAPATARVACNTCSDAGMLVGHPISWRSAKTGEFTRALIASPVAQTLIVLDEVDKLTPATISDNPFNVLLSLLEPENSRRLRDEYLEIEFDLSHALIVATANSTAPLPEPLLDRFLVVEISSPSAETRKAIARDVFGDIAGEHFEMPTDDILAQIAKFHPRKQRQIVRLALGHAARAGRDHVVADDLNAAASLGVQPAAKIGFF